MKHGARSIATVFAALVLAPCAWAEMEVADPEAEASVAESSEDGGERDIVRDDQGRVIAERLSDGTQVYYWYDSDGERHRVDPDRGP